MATRFVEPGRIAWVPSDADNTLPVLVDRFTNRLHCRAAIVGPHGSGKSTLLSHLVASLGEVVVKRDTYTVGEPNMVGLHRQINQPISGPGRKLVWLQMRGRAASAKLLSATQEQWQQPRTILVIDGFEQLSMFARTRITWNTWSNGVGLLVTSHRRTSLPTLINTKVDARLAYELLGQLLPEDLPDRAKYLDKDYLNQLLTRHEGNLREVFMQLYDEFE